MFMHAWLTYSFALLICVCNPSAKQHPKALTSIIKFCIIFRYHSNASTNNSYIVTYISWSMYTCYVQHNVRMVAPKTIVYNKV